MFAKICEDENFFSTLLGTLPKLFTFGYFFGYVVTQKLKSVLSFVCSGEALGARVSTAVAYRRGGVGHRHQGVRSCGAALRIRSGQRHPVRYPRQQRCHTCHRHCCLDRVENWLASSSLTSRPAMVSSMVIDTVV